MELQRFMLGKTGIEVTELCFGALPIGPSQKNLSVEEAADVIGAALKLGVNFVDTAQGYRTYPHIRKAMEMTGVRPVITSKSPAETYGEMEQAIEECLEALGAVDIFLLHAARAGVDVFEQRQGALACLMDYKAKGKLRAIGISTHSVQVAEAAAGHKDLDVVFPIINSVGMGILDGTLAEMEQAVERCFASGKGVYLMKALGGGNLVNSYEDALAYAKGISQGRAPIALGMVTKDEVEMNVRYFRGEALSGPPPKVAAKEFLVLKGICHGCGTCVQVCHSDAISLESGIPEIDRARCLTCGYCVGACPQFAIRMV